MVRPVHNYLFWLSVRYSSGLSYYHKVGSEPLRSITIGKLLDNAAEKWPDRRAFVSKHQNTTLTFTEVRDQANQLGASLLKLGLKPGDRIAALGATTTHWYITMLAAAKAGLILAGLNPSYVTAELKYSINKVGIKAIVMDHSFKNHDYYEMLTKLAPEIVKNSPSTPLKCKELPNLEYIIVVSDKEDLPGTYDYDEIMGLADNLTELHDISRRVQSDEPCNIQYTSGTTGYPKAATLTHFAVINNAHFFGKRCGLHKKLHTICLQVPLFHVFGSVLGVICATDYGASLIVPGPAFSKKNTIETLKEEQCTTIYGTPTMYVDLCGSIKEEIPNSAELKKGVQNFEIVVSGGAICTPKLFREIAESLNCTNVQSAYGMSELGPITFTNTADDTFEQRTTTVGHVAEHIEVKVVDPDGKMVPFGTPGEVWFRGFSLMLGYWGDEEKTKECITPDRWMKSGDLMVLTEDGYGQVSGRIKDIIIRGGENIVPIEIEELLQTHPKIFEVHVYGTFDKRLGEEVCANIKIHPGFTMTENEVKTFCKEKIASFKIPRHIRFVDDFPKTSSGKVKKNVLKKNMDKELNLQE